MEQLIDFIGNHPYLVSAAVALAVMVIVSEIRARIQHFAAVAPHEAVRLMNQGGAVIDVRSAQQYEAGHIGEARHIPQKELAANVEGLRKYREKPVITYCDTGMAGGAAARELAGLGFTRVFNLRGGLSAWQRENLPVVRGGDRGSAGKGTREGRKETRKETRTDTGDRGDGKPAARA